MWIWSREPVKIKGYGSIYITKDGGHATETCSNYRREGTAICNSNWAEWIRERFMRVV